MDLGPYFALERHRPDADPGPGWRSLRDLTDGVPGVLEERLDAVRAALAGMGRLAPDDVPPRVAGSVLHLGLVARLVSPVLGAAALTGRAPHVEVETCWWQPVLGGPVPVSLPDRPDVDAAEAVTAALDGPLAALQAAFAARSVPETVLRGNVASAVNGAYGQVARQRPDRTVAAGEAAAAFLAHPLLAGTSEGDCGPGFRRRSCCLIYQLAPPGTARYCGDCVLVR